MLNLKVYYTTLIQMMPKSFSGIGGGGGEAHTDEGVCE